MRKVMLRSSAYILVLIAVSIATCSPAQSQQFSDWSAPVNLGPVINTANDDGGPFISRDGLTLCFDSAKPGGFGGADLYVSHRASRESPWDTPINLGSTVNTSYHENACNMSPDEHRLIFQSNRPGGEGVQDLYVTRRHGSKQNDFRWMTPQNLGYPINTSDGEYHPTFYEDDATGTITLQFSRIIGGNPMTADIYASTLLPDETWGPVLPVTELNSQGYIDLAPTFRRDGLEVFFASNRPGSFGIDDLWVATRLSPYDPWSATVNLGSVVNCSECNQGHPSLSADGTALYFYSNRPGGYGRLDVWVITRTRIKE